MRDVNPKVWTTALESYIDTVIEGNGETFKNKAQVKILDVGEELFRLYCEKVFIDLQVDINILAYKEILTITFPFSFYLVDVNPSMSRKISERKHIVYQISSIFKFYERTFPLIEFDWIESHARTAKIMKSPTNSGIVQVDIKGTRISDGLDIFHMEVVGPPCNATDKHIMGDSKKTMRTDILNLIAVLRNHLDCRISLATKIKVYSMQSISEQNNLCSCVNDCIFHILFLSFSDARLTLYALSMLPDGRFLLNELATAVIPFSFNGRSQCKGVLRMMAIFHVTCLD